MKQPKVIIKAEWRIYQDQQTIRVENKINGKWVVKYVIMPTRLAIRRHYLYEVRSYQKPGHMTRGDSYGRIESVIKFIKVYTGLDLPEEIIDIIESWTLMDRMGRR